MKTPTDGAMKAVELKGRSWSNQYMRGIIASGVDPNGLVKNGTLPAITYYCPECRSSFELVEDVVNCPYCPIDPPTVKADRLDLSPFKEGGYVGELVSHLRSAYAQLDAKDREIGGLVGRVRKELGHFQYDSNSDEGESLGGRA